MIGLSPSMKSRVFVGLSLFAALASSWPVLQITGGAHSQPLVIETSAQDEHAETANRLLAEAEKLRVAATPASRREALEKYRATLPLWRNLGDRNKEAMARHGLCSAHNGLGERQVALGYCEQAVALRRDLNDQRGEAETLNVIGNIQLALHGPTAALDHFQRALALRRTLNTDHFGC